MDYIAHQPRYTSYPITSEDLCCIQGLFGILWHGFPKIEVVHKILTLTHHLC